MRFLSLAAALLITACATEAGYEEALDKWVGHHVDHLVEKWGPPHRAHTLTGGGQVLAYEKNRKTQLGGYTYTTPETSYQSGTTWSHSGGYGSYSGSSTTYTTQTTPVYDLDLRCVTTFTVNAEGIVTKWGTQGNNCIG